jgi:cytochrome P450
MTHDPENFHDPNSFNPERFIKDGKFEGDIRVCSFGVGLRSCIGKQIATIQYFIFATKIVSKFKIERSGPFPG